MVDFEEILSCSICMEIFRVPRVLPCQHTFCQDCISSYLNDSMKKTGKKRKSSISLTCPLCRKQVEIKKEPFDGLVFPMNLTIVALLDSQSSSCAIDHSSSTNKDSFDDYKTPTDSSVSECSFEQLLDMTDGFTEHISKWILNPIANYRKMNLKIIIACIELLSCMIIYSLVLNVIRNYDLWFLYLIFLVNFCKCIVVSAWNNRKQRDARRFVKLVLGHGVSHIFECALLGTLFTFFIFLVSILESIRTIPVRRYTVLSQFGHPQCLEEKIFDLKSILDQSVRIMDLYLSRIFTQYHLLKDNWFHYLEQLT